MSEAFRTKRFTYEGREFEAACYYDETMGAPGDEHDGHGSMREIRSRDEKRPGERLIERDRGYFAYDWQAAMQTARRNGWGLSDEETAKLAQRLGRTPTKGDICAEAVQRDYDHLRGWVREDWHWMGVGVRIIGADGQPVGDEYADAIWGFESEGDYWREVALEIAGQILYVRRKAWRERLQIARAVKAAMAKERAEREYWNSRDIETI